MADKARYLRNKVFPTDGTAAPADVSSGIADIGAREETGAVFCFKKFEWTSSKVLGVGLHASPQVEAATRDWRHNLVA